MFGVVCGFVSEVYLEGGDCSECYIVFQFFKTFSYFFVWICCDGLEL